MPKSLVNIYRQELQSGNRPVKLIYCGRECGGYASYPLANSKSPYLDLTTMPSIDEDLDYMVFEYMNGDRTDPLF